MEEDNYITDGTNFAFIKNATTIILYGILFVWIMMVMMVVVETVMYNMKYFKLSSFDDKIALCLAAAMFFALVASISKHKFDMSNFCLMNKNDPICYMDRVYCIHQRLLILV